MTPTPEAIEAALKAQYLALDRGANGETAFIAALAAYESAMEAAGFVRVPVEPTEAMLTKCAERYPGAFQNPMVRRIADEYRAMIAARPSAKT